METLRGKLKFPEFRVTRGILQESDDSSEKKKLSEVELWPTSDCLTDGSPFPSLVAGKVDSPLHAP